MNQSSKSSTDRRSNSRSRQVARVKMTLAESTIEGVSDNVSGAGLLFMSEESLRVQVEVETEDGVLQRGGRLVRAERMSAHNTGFAIEFDAE